jgi:hypothetical protein
VGGDDGRRARAPAGGAHHLVRDGRDAALSFVAMRRRPRFNWARPRGIATFACQWKLEVADARRFGRRLGPARYLELRYEDMVAEPESHLRDVCEFLELDFEPAMLEYHQGVDPGRLEDHPRLAQPPTPGVRRWRDEMNAGDAELFEAIAGDLLTELGYERGYPEPAPAVRARAALVEAAFRTRLSSWNPALAVARRSPAWRLRQAYIRRTARA